MSTEAMDGRMSLFDTVFSFLEEGGGVGGGGGSAEGGCHDGGDGLDSGDDEEGTRHSTAEKKAFWESQQQLLRVSNCCHNFGYSFRACKCLT